MLRRAPWKERCRVGIPVRQPHDTAICTFCLFPHRAQVAVSVHFNPFVAMRIQTLSRRTVGIPEADELKAGDMKDMARSLANLWEAAQRLPEGPERQDAFRQIGSFHWRVAALVTRAL